MKTIRICQKCGISFEADNREINRGNAKFCSLQCSSKSRKPRQSIFDSKCLNCLTQFKSKSAETKYCSKVCKMRYYRKQQINKEFEIKNLQIIFKDIPCEICGWKETTRDIHHIIPVAKGGKNNLKNLICLCPNHHRMMHKNLISQEAIDQAFKLRLYHHPELYQEPDANSGN